MIFFLLVLHYFSKSELGFQPTHTLPDNMSHLCLAQIWQVLMVSSSNKNDNYCFYFLWYTHLQKIGSAVTWMKLQAKHGCIKIDKSMHSPLSDMGTVYWFCVVCDHLIFNPTHDSPDNMRQSGACVLGVLSGVFFANILHFRTLARAAHSSKSLATVRQARKMTKMHFCYG